MATIHITGSPQEVERLLALLRELPQAAALKIEVENASGFEPPEEQVAFSPQLLNLLEQARGEVRQSGATDLSVLLNEIENNADVS